MHALLPTFPIDEMVDALDGPGLHYQRAQVVIDGACDALLIEADLATFWAENAYHGPNSILENQFLRIHRTHRWNVIYLTQWLGQLAGPASYANQNG